MEKNWQNLAIVAGDAASVVGDGALVFAGDRGCEGLVKFLYRSSTIVTLADSG